MKKTILATLILLTVLVSIGCQPLEGSGKNYDLVALKDARTLSGTFFLGSGSIGSTVRYIFYYRDNGSIRMQTCSIRHGYIHEGIYDCPYVNMTIQAGTERIRRADFYVPENSVLRQYTLDLD